MIYSNGDKYVGEWAKNNKEGEGTYYYKNGDVYKGSFVENDKQGFGKY